MHGFSSHVLLGRFVSKNSGVLFENDLLQIGVKAEFRKNLGRIVLYYGNKTQFPFNGFMPEVQYNGASPDQLNIQAKSVDPIIEIGVQKQQLINIECITEFTEIPLLTIQFLWVPLPYTALGHSFQLFKWVAWCSLQLQQCAAENQLQAASKY